MENEEKILKETETEQETDVQEEDVQELYMIPLEKI